VSEDNKNKIELKDHWFWSSVLDNKATYVQIFLASIFINVFGLGSAFYIMTVYDRVMPNNAMTTLVALTIELPDRFKLSPTGNSFILLSLTTSGILFAIFAPCFYIYPVGAVFLYGWLTGKLLVNPHLCAI